MKIEKPRGRNRGFCFSPASKIQSMKFKTAFFFAALCVASILPATGQQFPANATPVLVAGAPTNGTSEIQTLTIGGTPTAGTLKITFDGFQTGAITWSATNATLLANINTALDALPNLEDGEVVATANSLTAGIGTIFLTFGGNRAKLAVNTMTAQSSLTGTSPTAAITETTPGVTASGRSSAKGRLLINSSTPGLYQNTGTALAPVWSQIQVTNSELTALLAAIPTAAVADLSGTLTGTANGSLVDVAATAASTAGAATPSAAQVDTGIATAVASIVTGVNEQLKELQTKVNDLLAKLRTAGVVTP